MSIRAEAKFVTPDDYTNFFGQNLNAMLKIKNNTSNVANIFLMHTEDKILNRIDATSFRTNRWEVEDLSELQLENLQKAILYQAEYMIRNSDIFSDSGYDLEKGEVISIEKLQKIAICRTSIDLLKNCGLFNQVIKNRRRYPEFFG